MENILNKVLGSIPEKEVTKIYFSTDFIPEGMDLSPVGWSTLTFKHIGNGIWKCMCGCTIKPQSLREWEVNYDRGFYDSTKEDPYNEL